MKFEITSLSDHLPMSTRRVVAFWGEHCSYDTAIGHIDGLADGKVVLRNADDRTHYELTPEEARKIADALKRSACAIEQWQKKASGHYAIVVRREGDTVFVRSLGRERPMRESKLRRERRCDACGDYKMILFIAADNLRECGWRVQHVEVCPACIDRLAEDVEKRGGAIVVAIGGKSK